ncbi:MAG: SUF system FeS assembly protein, NifU family [candidate division WS6 bacterium GW2011_GWF2_39_15]|uniref:SUF system FeS assembly protein, NifU family n=1 Tax=candidate division WS6 bacterium GW2011_GWF2_39_15 TaxID=1619100 RepID=A0A0G0QV93_9BACT|nr:MAG: SUF system FeS assembly protein, NifU family [candidate division WS6 bacterium GW2011_GWF2_39_15]
MQEIYTKELIEHYKQPHRFGKMSNPDLVSKAVNEMCGDELTFYVKEEDGKVKDCSFEGSGCAICLGTMSMLIDEQIGLKIEDLKDTPDTLALERIGMKKESARIKCATLSTEVLRGLSK